MLIRKMTLDSCDRYRRTNSLDALKCFVSRRKNGCMEASGSTSETVQRERAPFCNKRHRNVANECASRSLDHSFATSFTVSCRCHSTGTSSWPLDASSMILDATLNSIRAASWVATGAAQPTAARQRRAGPQAERRTFPWSGSGKSDLLRQLLVPFPDSPVASQTGGYDHPLSSLMKRCVRSRPRSCAARSDTLHG